MDLEKLKKLCIEATPEPWVFDDGVEYSGHPEEPPIQAYPATIRSADGNNVFISDVQSTRIEDVNFIITARTVIPELIERIDELKNMIEDE